MKTSIKTLPFKSVRNGQQKMSSAVLRRVYEKDTQKRPNCWKVLFSCLLTTKKVYRRPNMIIKQSEELKELNRTISFKRHKTLPFSKSRKLKKTASKRFSIPQSHTTVWHNWVITRALNVWIAMPLHHIENNALCLKYSAEEKTAIQKPMKTPEENLTETGSVAAQLRVSSRDMAYSQEQASVPYVLMCPRD